MATTRLTEWERSSVRNEFMQTLVRSVNNPPFPVPREDIFRFGIEIMDVPEPVRKAYALLINYNKGGLANKSTYQANFKVQDEQNKLVYICQSGTFESMPSGDLCVYHTHPLHQEILKWCELHYQLQIKYNWAMKVTDEILDNCHSAGQLKRVLPQEAVRFLPNHMIASFKDAIRKSRYPAGLNIEQHFLDNLCDTLALGSINPEDRKGARVECTEKIEL